MLPHLQGIDTVITDPPYGIGLTNNDRDGHRRAQSYEILGDHDRTVSIKALLWADNCEIPTVAFASPWAPWPGTWRNLIAWDKGGAVGGGGDICTCLKRTWELIQIARNGAMNGGREDSVWRFPMVPSDTVDHIAAKPLPLMRALVQRFTNERWMVVDPFMGSGTTGVACALEGRRFIGVEIEHGHFYRAKRRIIEALNSQPLFKDQEPQLVQGAFA